MTIRVSGYGAVEERTMVEASGPYNSIDEAQASLIEMTRRFGGQGYIVTNPRIVPINADGEEVPDEDRSMIGYDAVVDVDRPAAAPVAVKRPWWHYALALPLLVGMGAGVYAVTSKKGK